MLGAAARTPGVQPSREQIEAALRRYLHTFHGEPHRRLLRQRRTLAAHWMGILGAFAPHLVGAVLDGSATRFSPLHLQLFTDNAKDVEMALLDRGLDIRVAPPQNGQGRVQEVIGFYAPDDGSADADDDVGSGAAAAGPVRVLLTVLDAGGLRQRPGARHAAADDGDGACEELHPIERLGRATAEQVRRLLAETAAAAAAADADG